MTILPNERDKMKALFEAVLGLNPNDRSTFLRENCTDLKIRDELERLVMEHDQATGFLSRPFGVDSESTASDDVLHQFPTGEILSGRFRVVCFIAAGGMGEVYEAEDLELQEYVAVKTIHPEILKHPSALARFKREVHLARKVTHPNVCRIYDLFRHTRRGAQSSGEIVFVSMELLRGRTLAEQIRQCRRLSCTQSLPIVKQLASALNAAHCAGIVHRDFKPSNVILISRDTDIPDTRAVITDFGLAFQASGSSLASAITGDGQAGTPAYMSPEQLAGNVATPASDIYAFGLVLYEMVTGVRPFDDGDNPIAGLVKRLGGPPRPPKEFCPELSFHWDATILKCLEHDPSKRYASAEAVFAALLEQKPSSSTSTFEDRSKKEISAQEIVLLYRRNAKPDEQLLAILETKLKASGFNVFVDRHLIVGMEWAREIEQRICNADAVVVLLSPSSVTSEMLAYEIQIAYEASQRRKGAPRILPIRLNFSDPLPDSLGRILNPIQQARWTGLSDNEALFEEIRASLSRPLAPAQPTKLEAVGGAVPLDSVYYVIRPTDEEFKTAIARNDSIVLVKGARQMGKTSLLARGLAEARSAGCKVVMTDFQQLNMAHLESIEKFLLVLGETLADELDLDVNFDEVWNPQRSGPSISFSRFLRREILNKVQGRLVWGMDEVDRLFTCKFGSEVFGLFRSWHNARSLDPSAPWHKLTLAIAYATEAHMFITDINQSPFNVGTQLVLEDFTLEQVSELSRRYGSPLRDVTSLNQFFELLGGQPYLTRRGLHELASQNMSVGDFEHKATRDDGPFGDHLRRILVSLAHDPSLCEVVKKLLSGRPSSPLDAFYRLRSAGIVSGESARDMRLRCRLYQSYLTQHLT